MSIIGIGLNLLLATLMAAALAMGWRLNRRLKALRDSHDGFALAVREMNTAAQRAEQGLADLRAATDEATDQLADRIEKGRALAIKLERLVQQQPVREETLNVRDDLVRVREQRAREESLRAREEAQIAERSLGALLAAAREARGVRVRPESLEPLELDEPLELRAPVAMRPSVRRPNPEDDLFAEPVAPSRGGFNAIAGGRR